MSWRTVVITQRAKLDLQLNYLVVRSDVVHKIHISEISVLLIENTEVSLTAALLAELIEQKVKVIFCDTKHNPCAEVSPYYGAFDSSSKIRTQIAWEDESKNAIWAEVVRNKINNQLQVLKLYGKEEAALLERYTKEIVSNDASNREGHAAKVYFNALFGKDFSRAMDVPINAALNYGYALLLGAVNREIVAGGYITQLGIHHCNVFNQFNLGADFMEAFRPFVDYKVYELWQSGKLLNFAQEEKLELVNVLNSDVLIDGRKQVLNYAFKIYCKGLLDALNDKDISLMRPVKFLLEV